MTQPDTGLLTRFSPLSFPIPATSSPRTWQKDGCGTTSTNPEEALVGFCLDNNTPTTDCWFALASYKKGWHTVATDKGERHQLRTRENAWFAKSLWLDLDVGDDKLTRPRGSAASAHRFHQDAKSTPPVGGRQRCCGADVTYAFDDELDIEDWRELAARFHAATLARNLHADPMRTRDSSSVLRAPGTWNLKAHPHQVQVLVEGKEAPVSAYKRILGAFEPIQPKGIPLRVNIAVEPPVVDFDGASYVAKYFTPVEPDYPTRDALEVIAACPQIRLMDSGKNRRGAPRCQCCGSVSGAYPQPASCLSRTSGAPSTTSTRRSCGWRQTASAP